MLNGIWVGMIAVSIFCAALTGRMDALSQAVFSGAGDAVQLVLSIAVAMAAWTGILKIAEAGGFSQLLGRLLKPATRRLLPEYQDNPEVIQAVCMNLTANLLGLGNAATPMGIAAMKAMEKHSGTRLRQGATDSMIRFVVLNTASIQLVPTMLASLRSAAGSASPFEILPAVWITSILTLCTGLLTARFLEGRHG